VCRFIDDKNDEIQKRDGSSARIKVGGGELMYDE
jgi:hypothetical protein